MVYLAVSKQGFLNIRHVLKARLTGAREEMMRKNMEQKSFAGSLLWTGLITIVVRWKLGLYKKLCILVFLGLRSSAEKLS